MGFAAPDLIHGAMTDSCEHGDEILGSIICWDFFLVAEQLLASQEGFRSMRKLVLLRHHLFHLPLSTVIIVDSDNGFR
jgi:hypothetical protein